jgi:DNA-binding HxlR family transcriptional regulator
MIGSRKHTAGVAMSKLSEALQSIEAVLARDPDPVDGPGAVGQLRRMLEDMEHDGNRRHDPIREVFARLGDRWSPLLLLLLQMRDFRHATLWRLTGIVAAEGQISQRILRLRLRTLEQDGLISRRVTDSRPPGVVYSLTAAGHGLVAQIHSLMNWSRQHSDEIRRAR